MSLRQDILAIGHALGLDKKDHSAANEREIADEIADRVAALREIICNTHKSEPAECKRMVDYCYGDDSDHSGDLIGWTQANCPRTCLKCDEL